MTTQSDAPQSADDAQISASASTSGLVAGIWIALFIAAAAAVYLLRAYMFKTYGAEAFESVCNFGESFNCDKINTSEYGKLGGFPVTIYALGTYVALAALNWLGTTHDDRGRGAMRLVQVGSGVAVAFGAFLLYVMVAIEGTFCVFCMTMDAMAVVVLVLSTMALKRMGPAEEKPDINRAVMMAFIAGGAIFSLGTMWHDDTKSALVSEQIERAAAEFKESEAAVAAGKTADKAGAGAAAVDNAGSNNAAASAGDASNPTEARKITDSLYAIPVHADDAVVGPADAAVTVIEYADFQCSYCKKLFYAVKTLKERYKGQVRFVFKHFPMNTICNKTIKNNRHRFACNAALTAECARRQGKFWPMHDMLFKNQHRLKKLDRDYYAHTIGLDMAVYKDCMRDRGAPRANLSRNIEEASKIGISATPRTFVNGKLLSGAVSAEVIDHFIEEELKKAGQKTKDTPVIKHAFPFKEPPKDAMVEIKLEKRSFWIDVWEASLDKQGRAVSMRGTKPANASWFEARAACEKAGKRMCTSEEWVSACQGVPAKDDDGDGNFANDYVEGNQFPYADYYEEGYCHVQADSRTGEPQPTGSANQCRTKTDVYDMSGNVAEWVESTPEKAFLAGGDYRAQDKAHCVRADDSFGPGHKNRSIGFRCCADKLVPNAGKAVEKKLSGVVGAKVPPLSATLTTGGTWSSSEMKGKVTFLTFFASWCSPCRRELPELDKLAAKYADKGFQVIAVGVDTDDDKARGFVQEVGTKVPVVLDPDAKMLGQFRVHNMPTGVLVDRSLTIRHKQVGYGTKTLPELEKAIAKIL